MKLKMGFNDAYKNWRNPVRKFNPESIVRLCMQMLQRPAANRLEEIKHAPWQVMLLVKWVCQDRMQDQGVGKRISIEELNGLRQKLWEFPEQVDLGIRETLPPQLFFRQLLRAQIGFQRRFTPGFVREAALLEQLPQSHQLRQLFEKKTGIGISEFLELCFATYVTVLDGQRRFNSAWFNSLGSTYSQNTIDAYLRCISRTYVELVAFCRNLPDADEKFASEFFQFPALSRYPFLRSGELLECWHPMVFYRGMEGFVHSVMSEAGQDYMNLFSAQFEKHVLCEAQKLPVPFLSESSLRSLMPDGAKVPDGLLCYSNCNVFIEAKAGMFDESTMTVGHTAMFSHKTRALRQATSQAWSASVSLRKEGRAPASMLNAEKDYLLIVTNKELSATRGTTLAAMYPVGTLAVPSLDSGSRLSLENIYVLSIEDFERLVNGTDAIGRDLPTLLADCVAADKLPETAVFYFEQHLDRLRIGRRYSDLVHKAIERVAVKLENSLGRESVQQAKNR